VEKKVYVEEMWLSGVFNLHLLAIVNGVTNSGGRSVSQEWGKTEREDLTQI
jgi:hypothetical protein